MTKEIRLNRLRGNTGLVTIVDDDLYHWLNSYYWNAKEATNNNNIYVTTSFPYSIQMHRLIMMAESDQIVDHKNGNSLDNRRENLRLCTASENAANARKANNRSSIFKGVTWDKEHNNWRSRIRVNGRLLHLGRFENEIEAARNYDVAAKSYFGEFAKTNGALYG